MVLEHLEFLEPTWIYGIVIALLFVSIVVSIKPNTRILSRSYVVIIYTLLAGSILLALAQPQITAFVPAQQVGTLTVLNDNSTSMQKHNINIDIPLNHQFIQIAQGNISAIVDRASANLPKQGAALLISDGYDTEVDSLEPLVKKALATETIIHVLNLESTFDDASVIIQGPDKTFVGAENQYAISIDGNDKLPGTLTVYVDDEEVLSTQELDVTHTVSEQFFDQQTHTVKAVLEIEDSEPLNNQYFKTTRVLPKPKVAYIGQNERFNVFLNQIFQVDSYNTLPENLGEYSSIILSNTPANKIQDAYALEEYVSKGNGLAVFGGNSAFDFGQYDANDISSILPTRNGIAGPRDKAIIVIVIDISASTDVQFDANSEYKAIEIQKAIAYDLVKQLADDNVVGIVAFNTEAFEISPLVPVKDSREQLLDKISRIQMQGNTRVNVGLGAAYQLLKDHTGTASVVFISDGITGGGGDSEKTREQVDKLIQRNIKIHPVAVGSQAAIGLLRQMAIDSGGSFVVPSETDRLLLNFGKANDNPSAQSTYSFQIENTRHPITNGVETPDTQLNNLNRVVPKTGAQVLVSANSGDPALTIWQYGVGRVATWTAFEGTDELRGFLNEDSLLTYRILSWTAGDPERNNPPLLAIDDTNILEPAKVYAHSASINELAEKLNTTVEELAFLNLEKISENEFTGKLYTNQTGLQTIFGATFATNYPKEFEKLGQSSAVKNIAAQTGGKFVTVEELDTLSITIQNPDEQVKTLKDITLWLIIASLVLLLVHITIKKIWERKNE